MIEWTFASVELNHNIDCTIIHDGTDAETKIFTEKQVNMITVDVLAPRVIRSSAAMIMMTYMM